MEKAEETEKEGGYEERETARKEREKEKTA